ncbi:MAG TPA: LexA family transcriptional regulator [Candidatus Paceibacterota bacterium]|nr:LexA family transcriptional regulator [Candidatus Paceibacterota bacterium]
MIDTYKKKIIAFYERHKRMPGYRELMDITGYKSKNAVYKMINKLVELGVLTKDADGRIALVRSGSDIPMLGLVEAGFPTVAEETELDVVNINTYLVEDRESSYLLEVKGDSMIDAGIHEGDLVVAEHAKSGHVPKEGDIVIAEVDGGWTMKYYRKSAGRIYLEPANKKYKPIYPEYDLKIAAIVKGVIRKY